MKDTLEIAEEFVKKINDFILKLLNSHCVNTFVRFFSDFDTKITKNDLRILTQACFANADISSKNDIIDFMKKPKELEERVFKESY